MSRERRAGRRGHHSPGRKKKQCKHSRWGSRDDAEREALRVHQQAMVCPACGWWKVVGT